MMRAMMKQRALLIPAVCLLLQAFGPAAHAALEKSSKKECALCHVMWLDVFRSDKETLIKWQPGNVLMKNTQGVVSSEALCYSCHDGYVGDARYTVWKGDNHPVFKKPSKNIEIPPTLSLSNKGEIYCGTCHSPHSGREAAPGASREETMPGPLSFLKQPNVDSSLCEACHVTDVNANPANRGGANHPVHTDKLMIPETLFARGSVKADRKNSVICQTCHVVHGAAGKHITVMDNRQSGLCMVCHKERTIAGTLHDARRTMPAETNRLGQPVALSGPCGACHVPHQSAGYKLWARQLPPGNPATRICLSCHEAAPEQAAEKQPSRSAEMPANGPQNPPGTKAEAGPSHAMQQIKGIGRYSHPLKVNPAPNAGGGTAPAPQAIHLPLFSPDGYRQTGGTLQCFTCHGIHQWNPDNPADRGPEEVRSTAADSFLRISADRSSALCTACHREKAGILTTDHNLSLSAPEAKNIRGETARVSGACGACHIAHNAAGPGLWARAVDDASAPAGIMSRYCTGCHGPKGAAEEKQVGKNDHPVNISLKQMNVPPADRILEELPLYEEQGVQPGGDRIMCETCHDPHVWSRLDTGRAPADSPAGAADAVANNVEGDARNSFLRKSASPEPDLCVVCHTETAMLMGTDHDFFISAPNLKNRHGQTIAQAGPCGGCHAVHNSPPGPLLWVQPYGPVVGHQHPMNALCTGCHSKGGIAQDKIPAVAGHPAGNLIDNIFSFGKRSTGYIKLFNDDFKEVKVGNLSCSSCHSFFQWDHRVKAPGPGRTVDGNAETSFLRTSSDKTVCIDCHGETAIWRYIYFHSIQKRAMLDNVWP